MNRSDSPAGEVVVYPTPRAFLEENPGRKLDGFGVYIGGMDFGDRWNRVEDANSPRGLVSWRVSYLADTAELYAEQCVLSRDWSTSGPGPSPDDAREVWLLPVTFRSQDEAYEALVPLERSQRQPDSLLWLVDQLRRLPTK